MPTTNPNTGVSILRNAGLRPTLGRLAVLGVLMERDEMLTASEIFDYQDSMGGGINLGTVYTTLKQLTQANVIIAHTDIGRKVMYSLHTRKEINVMTCSQCGESFALEDSRIHPFVSLLCKEHGASLERFKLHISVTCKTCLRERR